MIEPLELNLKAKKPDPWSGPFIQTMEQLEKAFDDGKWVGYYRPNPDIPGEWVRYDTLDPAARVYSAAYLVSIWTKYKFKVHNTASVVVYRPVIIKGLGGSSPVVTVLLCASRKKIDEKIQHLHESGRLLKHSVTQTRYIVYEDGPVLYV